MTGNLLTLEIKPDGLHLILTPDGREYLEDQVESRPDVGRGWIVWKTPGSTILCELLEDYACNGGPELLHEHNEDYLRIGALTEAPIIAYDVERDDDNELEEVGRVFWFPNYMVEDELETLLEKGEVVFDEAEDA